MKETSRVNAQNRRDSLGQLTLAPGETLTVLQASHLLGVSPHTLRYYERIGFVDVPRNPAGHRSYDQRAFARLVFILRMRNSGMNIDQLRRYLELVAQGEGSVPERLQLMRAHRDQIRQQIEQLEAALALTEFKINTYAGDLG